MRSMDLFVGFVRNICANAQTFQDGPSVSRHLDWGFHNKGALQSGVQGISGYDTGMQGLGFATIRGSTLGVPSIARILVFRDLYSGTHAQKILHDRGPV